VSWRNWRPPCCRPLSAITYACWPTAFEPSRPWRARRQGPLPASDALAVWATSQPQLAGDPGFAATFLDQLAGLGEQLASIAGRRGRDPLALELADLISWAEHQAQERLELSPFRADSAAPPPG